MIKDRILSDNVFVDQKKIRNPDGTMNYNSEKKKTAFGIFNTCFVASGTGSAAQIITRSEREYTRISTGSLIDANAYFIALLSVLNSDSNGEHVSLEDNDKRYHWAEHAKFWTKIINGSFEKPLIELSFSSFSLDKVIYNIDSGYQLPISIWIGDFHKGGRGHIVCPVGYRVDEKGTVLGLFVNDPAGNILSKKVPGKAYYNNEEGHEVYYPREIFPKLFKKGNHMMNIKELV